MKKLNLLSLIAITSIIFFTQCCKKKTPVTPPAVDVCTYSTESVTSDFIFSDTGATTVPAIINLFPTGTYIPSVYSKTVPSTVDSQLTADGKHKACQAKLITMKQLRVLIDSPANMNFDFISGINLFMAKKGSYDSVLVAQKTGIPAGSKSIIMDIIPNVNLRDYVLSDSFRFVIGATKSNQPVANTTDKTYLRFDASFSAKIFTK
jgi:hypothetical protein